MRAQTLIYGLLIAALGTGLFAGWEYLRPRPELIFSNISAQSEAEIEASHGLVRMELDLMESFPYTPDARGPVPPELLPAASPHREFVARPSPAWSEPAAYDALYAQRHSQYASAARYQARLASAAGDVRSGFTGAGPGGSGSLGAGAGAEAGLNVSRVSSGVMNPGAGDFRIRANETRAGLSAGRASVSLIQLTYFAIRNGYCGGCTVPDHLNICRVAGCSLPAIYGALVRPSAFIFHFFPLNFQNLPTAVRTAAGPVTYARDGGIFFGATS